MYKERISICEQCDKLTKLFKDTVYQCSECKCVLNIKARMSRQECPLGKWGKENNDILSEECGGCS